MSKNKKKSSARAWKIRLLNVAILAAVLLALFMLQNSWSLLPQFARRAAGINLRADQPLVMLEPGVKAPDFSLASVGGQVVSLKSFEGSRVALVFGNRDCPHCHSLIDGLAQMCSPGSPPVLVIMVSPDSAWQAKGSCLRMLNGTADLFVTYGVTAIPTMYLVDEEQRIIASKSQFADEDRSQLVAELTDFMQK